MAQYGAYPPPGSYPPPGAPGAPPPGGYGPPGGAGAYGPPGGAGAYGPPGGAGAYGPPGGAGAYGQPGAGGYGPPGAYGAPPGAPGAYGAPPGAYGAPGGGYPGGGGSFMPPPASFQAGLGGQYYAQIAANQAKLMELRGWFKSVDKDNSGHITARELSQMQFAGQKFSLATAEKLIKVFDLDGSRSISFHEYAALHQFISGMNTAYQQHDRDGSGKLDEKEVHLALQAGGFQLSSQTVRQLYRKFKQGNTSFAAGGLNFEQFLCMAAYLGQCRATFMVHDTNRNGWIQINLETLVQITTAL